MRAGLDERLENRVQFVLRNAHAGVLHFDDERDVAAGLLFFPSDAHFNAALVGELDRVADQIDQNLPQPDAVHQQRVRQIFGDVTFQPEFFFGRRFGKQRVDEIANLAQIGRFGMQFHHARLDFRHVENVVDEQQQRVGAGADGLQVLPVLRFAQIALQQFAEAENGVHRRADFVAHVGEEDGFFLVAVLGLQFGFRQFAFMLLMLYGNAGQPQREQSRANPENSRDQRGQIRVKHAVENFLTGG